MLDTTTNAQPPGPTPALAVHGVSKRYPIQRDWWGRPVREVHAVRDVSLAVAPGEVLGLVGESGCGKTSLARLMVKLGEPSDGRIELDGEDIGAMSATRFRPMRKKVQMVFQDPFASLDPRMPVGRSVAEGLLNFGLARNWAEALERTTETMVRVGLRAEQRQRFPHEFSGGQRQRLGIARAIVVEPRLLVCDEPVSALDVSVQAQVVNLLAGLQRERGLAMVFVSHDLAVVQHISDRVAVMYLGRVVEQAPSTQLFARPAHPYTRALLDATPRAEAGQRRVAGSLPSLRGEVANPAAPPAGCAFHTRCPHAQERCRHDVPEQRDIASGHRVACHFDLF